MADTRTGDLSVTRSEDLRIAGTKKMRHTDTQARDVAKSQLPKSKSSRDTAPLKIEPLFDVSPAGADQTRQQTAPARAPASPTRRVREEGQRCVRRVCVRRPPCKYLASTA